MDFSYLNPSALYFDSACQTLRPQPVIDAEVDYYHHFNSCGGRVKYAWGQKTDQKVEQARSELLKLVGKSEKEYTVAFCLNTTQGINLVLHQIPPGVWKRIVTSEREHNSIFLPTISYAKKHHIPRLVLPRSDNEEYFGALLYEKKDVGEALVLVNTMSNIDGQVLCNMKKLGQDIREAGGLFLIDACQTFAHNPEILRGVDFDAMFGSGHKMYGPSVGFIIIRKLLLNSLEYFFIGGSTVQDVQRDNYNLVETDLHSRLEPGLQNYAGIIGLAKAIEWRSQFSCEGQDAKAYEQALAKHLHKQLQGIKKIHLTSSYPSPIVSLFCDDIDSHTLAIFLSEAGIMCRSGYHCCHYFLKNLKKYPPLLRISLGLHNTEQQIDTLMEKLKIIL